VVITEVVTTFVALLRHSRRLMLSPQSPGYTRSTRVWSSRTRANLWDKNRTPSSYP